MSNTASKGLRTYLRGLARSRRTGRVTADDARRYLTRQGITATQDVLSTINTVLNTHNPDVTRVGFTTSSRPEAKGRQIAEWQFA